MSDYSITTDFSVKDGLTTGDAEKIILGSDFDVEFDALVVAIASKANTADKGVAGGYASLDGSTLILAAELPTATTTAIGALETATDAEATALAATNKIVTPANLDAVIELMPGVGLTEAAGVLTLDVNELSSATPVLGDEVVFADGGTTSKLATFTVLNGILTLANLSDYDSNDHIDHTTVTLTAGNGLTGGGTIAASRTFNVAGTAPVGVAADAVTFDISGLSALTAATLDGADTFLVDDGDGGTNKKITYASLGPDVVESDASPADLFDGNKMFVNSGSVDDTVTIPANASVAYPIGTQFGFFCASTGTINVAVTSDTIVSLLSNKQVKASGGGAYCVKTAATTWALIGDLEA
jgi:hypothetical protein